MRSLTDTLTSGPFLDATHRAAVEAAAEDLGGGPSPNWEPCSDVSGHRIAWQNGTLYGRCDHCGGTFTTRDGRSPFVSQTPLRRLGGPQAAISGGPATSVWSGGRNGSGDLPTKLTQVEANPLYPALQSAWQQVNEAERELRKFGYRNRKQAPGMRPPKATVMLVAPDALGAHVTILQDAFAAIYDAATRFLASAGPLPRASTEPGVDSVEAYAKRLGATDIGALDRVRQTLGGNLGMYLAHAGRAAGLPRARLVPADVAMRDVKPTTTQQGEP